MNPHHDRPGRVAPLVPYLVGDDNIEEKTVLALQLAGGRGHERGVLPRRVRLRADPAVGAVMDAGRALVDGVPGQLEPQRADGGSRVPDVGEVVVCPLVR